MCMTLAGAPCPWLVCRDGRAAVKDHPPGSAIALAAAILSLPLALFPLLGVPLAVVGLVLGWHARKRMRERPDAYRESAMPSAAQVVAIIGLACSALMFLLWTLFMAIAALGSQPPPAEAPLLF
jgi:hypothetical protein